MSLFVRHSAWLNAVPEKADSDKAGDRETKDRPPSRIKRMKEGGIIPEVPEVDVPYLLNYFFEVGPAMAGGMGEVPLSHSEISAWQENTGVELTAWEARTLKRLSIDYLNEAGRATRRNCPAPWLPESHAVDAVATENDLRNSLRALSKL